MAKNHPEKFEQLEEEKKLRIINAAMEEFTNQGYERASTIQIAEKAGISKGSLFFYFGSKKELYRYILNFATKISYERTMAEYPYEERDLLNVFQQVSRIKFRLAEEFPRIFDFLLAAYTEEPRQELYTQKYEEVMTEFSLRAMRQVDASRLRDGITAPQAIQLLYWVTEGIGHQVLRQNPENKYAKMLEVANASMSVLRIMLYKEEWQ